MYEWIDIVIGGELNVTRNHAYQSRPKQQTRLGSLGISYTETG